ncbi:zinc finger protein 708 [Nilaparvata lugens]|uniref:zinc finger protein 708 n=1 Tax=Nilaparvata lugens TaxID=108931 RepID=UPI00193DA6DF|nr:zinc finger protein 708 [Nilaparvata lugens]
MDEKKHDCDSVAVKTEPSSSEQIKNNEEPHEFHRRNGHEGNHETQLQLLSDTALRGVSFETLGQMMVQQGCSQLGIQPPAGYHQADYAEPVCEIGAFNNGASASASVPPPTANPTDNKQAMHQNIIVYANDEPSMHEVPCNLCNVTFSNTFALLNHTRISHRVLKCDDTYQNMISVRASSICREFNEAKTGAVSSANTRDVPSTVDESAVKAMTSPQMITHGVLHPINHHQNTNTLHHHHHHHHQQQQQQQQQQQVPQQQQQQQQSSPLQVPRNNVHQNQSQTSQPVEISTTVASIVSSLAATNQPANSTNKYGVRMCDKSQNTVSVASVIACSHVCTVCNKAFNKPSDLVRHSIVHTEERPFTCDICSSSFRNSSNLRMHLLTHSDTKPHPCTVCEKSFRRLSDLERHTCLHTGARPFGCTICGMAFTTNYNLKIHSMKHTGSLPYPCTQCDKSFSKPSELQRHLVIHTGERPFSCPQCGMAFSNSSNLRNHMITHTGRRPYPCSMCDKAFTRPSDVKRHVLIHTGARPFACQICGLAFADSSNLKKHTLTHTKNNKGFNQGVPSNNVPAVGVQCNICSVVLQNLNELNNHLIAAHSNAGSDIVSNNRGGGNNSGTKETDGSGTYQVVVKTLMKPMQYECAVCGVRFVHAIHLQEHSLTHDREHSFQCEICDKSFAQETFLQQHLLTHTEARPFECPECYKCFKSSSHLKNHVAIHSGVKPYTCETCNKSFLKQASLRRHQATHARGNRIPCAVCGKTFLNMEYLRKHTVTHTNVVVTQ